MGQGAIVKELELIEDIIPSAFISTKRWVDMLSKLNLWKQSEWDRLVFLDAAAFPVRDMDDIFDIASEQKCDRTRTHENDVKGSPSGGSISAEMCSYVYAGVPQYTWENINAGMLVLKPNMEMHSRLIRAAHSTDDYSVRDMEQGVLKSKNAFAADGPFPPRRLPPIWNAYTEYYVDYVRDRRQKEDGLVSVIHGKIWSRFWGSWCKLTHLNDMWDVDWMTMSRLYDSETFATARKEGIYPAP